MVIAAVLLTQHAMRERHRVRAGILPEIPRGSAAHEYRHR